MKVMKIIGIILKGIGALLFVGIIVLGVITIKQEKEFAADCEMLEALVEVIEQAKETSVGAHTLSIFITPGEPDLRQLRILVNPSGCDIVPHELYDENMEIAEAFKTAMDSVNPNWRTDYASVRKTTYEIRLYGGSGRLYFEKVPYKFAEKYKH